MNADRSLKLTAFFRTAANASIIAAHLTPRLNFRNALPQPGLWISGQRLSSINELKSMLEQILLNYELEL